MNLKMSVTAGAILIVTMVSFVDIARAGEEKTTSRAEIQNVIDAFAKSLTDKDEELFLSLFVEEKPTWIGVTEPIMRAKILADRPDHDGLQFGDHIEFIKWICSSSDSLEEKFWNVVVIHDEAVASVTFDFSFLENEKVTNWGKESWHLVNSVNGWKICSVVFTLTSAKSNPFPGE